MPDRVMSPHFALSELLASQTATRMGIPNGPPDDVLAALEQLATSVLEPLRLKAGPLHVDSGYRSVALNAVVGGAANSAHTTGSAADLKPLAEGLSLRGLMDLVLNAGLQFDQVIWEYGSWVHVGLRGPDGVQRGQRLMIFSGGPYQAFDKNDPRVSKA